MKTLFFSCSLAVAIAFPAICFAQKTVPETIPLVQNLDRPFQAPNGLEKRHIALWGSHGLYYELANARWEWQRARMFETVEDKLPSSFVIPYLSVMLENAGAVTIMPRERDVNPYEVLVDNDGQLASSSYIEQNGSKTWITGEGQGFAFVREVYKDFENPFTEGSFRQAETIKGESGVSCISWTPDIPSARSYAVYVSYKSLPNSTTDARYTVYHKGGQTHFSVNQTMGGSTWIYLGTFEFEKGLSGKVVLTNQSAESGRIVTADAVRFGGGMGNIARAADGSRVYDNTKLKKTKATSIARTENQPIIIHPYEVSGYPRYAEAARYYLQWAGIPHSVYSLSNGTNDYTDDYRGRGAWVNYLAGGSAKLPGADGLKIPIDLSLALHTDGGSVDGDNTIGTLGIYETTEDGGRFGDGSSRLANGELCKTVYNSVLNDVRRQIEPQWSGRNCRDKKYSECTVPRVPSMLLELLSHESYGEMRYANDPRFKFVVSRAIYKGILRFISKRNGYDYIVQPLPVSNFAASFDELNHVVLTWNAVVDSIEPTAVAEKYIVYRRIGNGDFDNGTLVNDNRFVCDIPADKVVSFKVTAWNRGGQSFPSEILSVGRNSRSSEKPVLIINGFDRISGPDDFVSDDDQLAGFLADVDNGVPYLNKMDYVGKQVEFRRSIPMTDDDNPGFGASNSDEDKTIIAGNSFDYPAIHGHSLLNAGRSFVSISRSAIEDLLAVLPTDSTVSFGKFLKENYAAIDLILGKQKQSKMGRKGANPLAFKTFDAPMQNLLTSYCQSGGSVFVSGAYVGTDLWQNPLSKSQKTDREFAQHILKYKWRTDKAAVTGAVKMVTSPLSEQTMSFDYYNRNNENCYSVESPDAIVPADSNAFTAFRYSENGQSAGVVFGGTSSEPWRTVVLAVPFETIKSDSVRDDLMSSILHFLLKEK